MKSSIRKPSSGFSLIELMVAVAIVGVLYALAMPAYTSYVEKGRRADVQQQLLQLAGVLERAYSRNGAYPDDYSEPTLDYYTLTYTPNNPGDSDDYSSTSFSLSAAPKGAQSGDDCGTLTINSLGEQSATGGADCWES